jgi:hypothetical protein
VTSEGWQARSGQHEIQKVGDLTRVRSRKYFLLRRGGVLPLNAANGGAKRNLALYDVVYVRVIEGKTVAKPKTAGGTLDAAVTVGGRAAFNLEFTRESPRLRSWTRIGGRRRFTPGRSCASGKLFLENGLCAWRHDAPKAWTSHAERQAAGNGFSSPWSRSRSASAAMVVVMLHRSVAAHALRPSMASR